MGLPEGLDLQGKGDGCEDKPEAKSVLFTKTENTSKRGACPRHQLPLYKGVICVPVSI